MQVKGFCLQDQCPRFRNTNFLPESFMMKSEGYRLPKTAHMYPSKKGVIIFVQLWSTSAAAEFWCINWILISAQSVCKIIRSKLKQQEKRQNYYLMQQVLYPLWDACCFRQRSLLKYIYCFLLGRFHTKWPLNAHNQVKHVSITTNLEKLFQCEDSYTAVMIVGCQIRLFPCHFPGLLYVTTPKDHFRM